MKKVFSVLFLIAVCFTPVYANLLGDVPVVQGTSVFTGNVTGDSPGTLLADQIHAFSIPVTGNGTMSGLIESAVYRDADGTLDFYYQVTNTSPNGDSFSRTSESNFAGFLTNVGFRTDGGSLTGTTFTDSIVAPPTSDRSSLLGVVVGFNFNALSPFGDIAPGEKSAVLVVDTNATQFTLGAASAINSGTGTVLGYAPTSVPEPASILMLGTALLGVFLFAGKLVRKVG